MNRGSTGRKLRHREADRLALLAAAERIFATRGYHATAIRDIAREAGFSVGGVYQFFDSKDDLYLALIEEQWRQYWRAIDAALVFDGCIARLTAFARASLEYFQARRAFFQLFFVDRARFSPSLQDRAGRALTRNRAILRQRVTRLMRAGMREGVLQLRDTDLLVAGYLGILHNTICDELGGDRRRTPRPEAIVSLFLGGAAVPAAARHARGQR